MDSLLSRSFLERLRALGDRLAEVVRRLEITRITPTGQVTIPEPDSHRPYAPGDDPRYIDWNLYARTNRFYIKSMLKEEEGLLNVLVDTSSSMVSPHPDKLQRALETAAAFAFLTLLAGSRVRVYGFSSGLVPGGQIMSGERAVPSLLNSLARLGSGGPTDLKAVVLDLLRSNQAAESRVLLLSDLLGSVPPVGAVEMLKEQGIGTSVLHILHPAELSPRRRGNLLLQDAESDQQVSRVVGYRSLRRMEKTIRDYVASAEEGLRGRGISYTRALTDLAFEEIVVSHLRSVRGF